jgi:hypothetical protein
MKITDWAVTPHDSGSLVHARVNHKGSELHACTFVAPGVPVLFDRLVPEIRRSVLKAVQHRRTRSAKKCKAARAHAHQGRTSPTPLPAMRASTWRAECLT